jgi:hypothetical protein
VFYAVLEIGKIADELSRIEADMKKAQDDRIKEIYSKLVAEKKDKEAEVLRIKYKALFPSPSIVGADLKEWKRSVVHETRTKIVAENFRKKFEDAQSKLEVRRERTVSLGKKVLAHGPRPVLDELFAKEGVESEKSAVKCVVGYDGQVRKLHKADPEAKEKRARGGE